MDDGPQLFDALTAFVGGRIAKDVITGIWTGDVGLPVAIVDALPHEQIAAIHEINHLGLTGVVAVAAYAAALRRVVGREGWLHHNLTHHLDRLAEDGVAEARLPAIIHAMLAVKLLRETESTDSLPRALAEPNAILAKYLHPIAPGTVPKPPGPIFDTRHLWDGKAASIAPFDQL